jgi:hypothetical protein
MASYVFRRIHFILVSSPPQKEEIVSVRRNNNPVASRDPSASSGTAGVLGCQAERRIATELHNPEHLLDLSQKLAAFGQRPSW